MQTIQKRSERNMNNKLEVIGIDHGWSMMKTIFQVFVTGVTKAVLAPMKAVKKMLVSMELHLDASIDKLDNLAMDVRMDKEKNKDDMKHDEQMEADRKEAAPERVEAEIVYAPVVAETHEYQYNADAFEARGAADMKVEIGKEVSKVREDKAR